jgi:hypothetical protein
MMSLEAGSTAMNHSTWGRGNSLLVVSQATVMIAHSSIFVKCFMVVLQLVCMGFWSWLACLLCHTFYILLSVKFPFSCNVVVIAFLSVLEIFVALKFM